MCNIDHFKDGEDFSSILYLEFTPRTRVCAIYRTPLGCFENLIRADIFIYPCPMSELTNVILYKVVCTSSGDSD